MPVGNIFLGFRGKDWYWPTAENLQQNYCCKKGLMKFLNTEEKKQRRLVHIPMGRFGEAKEMAYAALFLASDESSFVTGTDFLVDGGITSAYVTPL